MLLHSNIFELFRLNIKGSILYELYDLCGGKINDGFCALVHFYFYDVTITLYYLTRPIYREKLESDNLILLSNHCNVNNDRHLKSKLYTISHLMLYNYLRRLQFVWACGPGHQPSTNRSTCLRGPCGCAGGHRCRNRGWTLSPREKTAHDWTFRAAVSRGRSACHAPKCYRDLKWCYDQIWNRDHGCDCGSDGCASASVRHVAHDRLLFFVRRSFVLLRNDFFAFVSV